MKELLCLMTASIVGTFLYEGIKRITPVQGKIDKLIAKRYAEASIKYGVTHATYELLEAERKLSESLNIDEVEGTLS